MIISVSPRVIVVQLVIIVAWELSELVKKAVLLEKIILGDNVVGALKETCIIV